MCGYVGERENTKLVLIPSLFRDLVQYHSFIEISYSLYIIAME